MKTVVVGLDGASWSHLGPWLEAGEMPYLSRLMEQGAWSRSASELPYVTFPNWKCYSTGKNPGKLGVYWWEVVDVKGRSASVPNAMSFHGEEIFGYLDEVGCRCGVMNMPTTHPPMRLDHGFAVAGGPGCPDTGYTSPIALEDRLKDRGYRVHPTVVRSREAYVSEVMELIDKRFELGRELLDEVDFLQITVFYINMLQHFYWRDPLVLDAWKGIDRQLGRLMELECNLVLLSDHGCHRIHRVFNINRWLEENGFLSLRKDPVAGRLPEGVRRLASRMGRNRVLRNSLVRWAPEGLVKGLARVQDQQKGTLKFRMIDWDRTTAFASGQGPLYLNPSASESSEALLKELCDRLPRVRDPETGECPFTRIHRSEEIYNGPYLTEGPDLVLEQNDGFFINGRVGSRAVFESTDRWKAENHREGIFLLYGKDVAPGPKGETSILDIAPTLLHWLGQSVPLDMDGTVQTGFFEKGSPTASTPVSFRRPKDTRSGEEPDDADEDAVRRQLIQLGYME